jgi:hypothetical protein
MKTSPETQQNRFEQWISLTLKNATATAPGPSRQVWYHIAGRLKTPTEAAHHPTAHHRQLVRRVE